MSQQTENTLYTGALGESLVVSELLWHGWAPANLNQIVSNSPNVDILAAKNNRNVAIQIKTSGPNSKNMLQVGNGFKEKVFNTKIGPQCEFVIFVRIFDVRDYECYVVPVDEAERVVQLTMHDWMNAEKRDGSKRNGNFPLCIRFEENRNRPDVSNFKEKWAHFKDAWHLLDNQG